VNALENCISMMLGVDMIKWMESAQAIVEDFEVEGSGSEVE
jgi:hypothetical protein